VDIAPLNSAENIDMLINQTTMIAGKKQQKTTNAAAIHLNMIFRTDQNGISKSTTDTRCDDDKTGGGAGGTTEALVGGGSCVPYFNIGR
jgi:hypothetical protein